MLGLLLLTTLLSACADPYGDAKTADTIEAWDAYLATAPTGTNGIQAKTRLEALMVARAESSHALADYDSVLTKFPATGKKKAMIEGRANAAFALAEEANTAEAFTSFLMANPAADGALKKRAKQLGDVAEFAARLTIAPPVVVEVNLAHDAAGPKDGWGFSAAVTNNGDVALEYANIELQYLGADGKKIKAVAYPVAAEMGPGRMPIEEALQKPLAPAETRTWSYETNDVPEGWLEGKQVKLALVGVRAVPTAVAGAPK